MNFLEYRKIKKIWEKEASGEVITSEDKHAFYMAKSQINMPRSILYNPPFIKIRKGKILRNKAIESFLEACEHHRDLDFVKFDVIH